MFEVVTSYKWPTDGLPFVSVEMRASEVASRVGVVLQNWAGDGLGPATGFGFRTLCGRVYLLQELEEACKHLGARGPSIYADATEILSVGAEALTADVIEALDLDDAQIRSVPEIDGIAAKFIAMIAHPNNSPLAH